MADTFLYFGFGSNLLKERIRLRNPSAEFITAARLQGYRLDFYGDDTFGPWYGAAATITNDVTSHVWGSVWRMDQKDMESLDDQEGVPRSIYFPIQVDVETADGEKLQCRTYQMNTEWDGFNIVSRKPSPQYLSVILRGAKDSKLPDDYIKSLEKVEDNGYSGPIGVKISSE